MDLDLKKLPKFVYIFVITLLVAIVYWIFIGRALIENGPTMVQEHQDNVTLIAKYDNALSQEQNIRNDIEKKQKEYEIKYKDMFITLMATANRIH